jgi:hypothetical protein
MIEFNNILNSNNDQNDIEKNQNNENNENLENNNLVNNLFAQVLADQKGIDE